MRLCGIASTRWIDVGVLGVVQREVAEQRVDRREAVVAGRDRVAAIVLEVVKERGDQRRVELRDVELARRRAQALCGEVQQQPEAVAVGGDRVRAGGALADQPVGRRTPAGSGRSAVMGVLRSGRQGAGRRAPSAPGSRSDTSRCLTARRARGRSTARRSARRCASPECWQSISVLTAKLWRRSCERGRTASVRSPSWMVSFFIARWTAWRSRAPPSGVTKNVVELGLRAEPVAGAGVVAQRVDAGRVQRQQPGALVLGDLLADADHAGREVDVVTADRDDLSDAHAGHGQQPEQRLRGGGLQRRLRALRRLQQAPDVGLRPQVGRRSLVAGRRTRLAAGPRSPGRSSAGRRQSRARMPAARRSVRGAAPVEPGPLRSPAGW